MIVLLFSIFIEIIKKLKLNEILLFMIWKKELKDKFLSDKQINEIK